MRIVLPDNSVKEYAQPVTPYQVAREIGERLAMAAIGAKVDGQLWDLHREIPSASPDASVTLAILTKPRTEKDGKTKGEHNPDALYLLRHSTAHVMAEALQRIWPEAKLAYGPPLETGFYYDISLEKPISTEDFEKIEAEMAKIIGENRPFTRYELSFEKGFEKLRRENNKYKLDNADRAQKAGSTSLSWYVTGLPKKTRINNAGGIEIFELGGDPNVRIPASSLNGHFIDASQSWKHEGEVDYTVTHRGDWEDLCMGPHVPTTGVIGGFKVTSIAASNWHGDVKSDRFQRVYGTAFFTKADLDANTAQLEEAKQRDHRVIGQKLGLFCIDEQVGQGLVLWKPKGGMIRTLLQNVLQEELFRRGYSIVYTPNIGKIDLYKTSGHYPYYAEGQFPTIKMKDHPHSIADVKAGGTGDEEEYLLKPMNCPHHIKIYASDPHSYRDLPVRLAEFGTVYRFEKSGELNGMTRVRGFTQDDAHIFCTEAQVKAEFRSTIELVQWVFQTFGFKDVQIRLGLRDPESSKYAGTPELWNRAEGELRELLNEMQVSYIEGIGEAAFYGPKTDFLVKDVIGRKWQLGTVQLDYNLPQRFDLKYTGSDNTAQRPVMIHRAPFGSMERFMAILIEHFNGAFPLWLAAEQVRVLPISDKFLDYATKVTTALKAAGFRATLDLGNDRVQAKIKVASEEKIPYMLVVGGKDEAANAVSVRDRTRGDLGALPLDAFIAKAKAEVESKGTQIVAL